MMAFNKAGFTRTELITVIIALLLLVFIVPSAISVGARAHSRRMVCSAQMRSYGQAVHCFIRDNDDWFPPYADESVFHSSSPAWETMWMNSLGKYVGGEEILEEDSAMVKRIKHDRNSRLRIRECPTGRSWVGVHYGGSAAAGIDAPFLVVRADQRGFRYGKIAAPSAWIVMLDSTGPDGWGVYSPNGWGFDMDFDGDGVMDSNMAVSSFAPYNSATPKVHANGCNVVMADGRVHRFTFAEWQEPANPLWCGRPSR